MSLDSSAIRRHFPFLLRQIDGHPIVYLDSAATAQKPQAVLDRMQRFYEEENANVHRGMHVLAERATVAYEDARRAVRKFLNAAHAEEIIFTKSCTEAINLVAKSWGRENLHKGDVVVLSLLEHHSNIVPWLQLKEEIGFDVRWIDIDDSGNLRMEMLDEFLEEGNVKLIAITAQSNVLGTRPPLAEIIAKAHGHGALVFVDAAQSVSHHPTDVQTLDCDFLAFSGHKLYGPTGIGVLYGKRDLLRAMPPFLGGGMMIQEVHQDRFTSADIPQKFEAGTPPIAQTVGLGAAIEWLGQYSWKEIEAHEQSLIAAAIDMLRSLPDVTILGPAAVTDYGLRITESRNPLFDSAPIRQAQGRQGRQSLPVRQAGAIRNLPSGCVSFTVKDIHPHDLTEILGRQGICLRAGHHCTQPLHRRLGITASTRLSMGIYNTVEEVMRLSSAIPDAINRLRSPTQ